MPKAKTSRSFATDASVPVELLLDGDRWIEGTVHVSSEPARFSDAWEQVVRDPRAYVALTDSVSRSADGSLINKNAFLLVRKASVVAIRPLDDT